MGHSRTSFSALAKVAPQTAIFENPIWQRKIRKDLHIILDLYFYQKQLYNNSVIQTAHRTLRNLFTFRAGRNRPD